MVWSVAPDLRIAAFLRAGTRLRSDFWVVFFLPLARMVFFLAFFFAVFLAFVVLGVAAFLAWAEAAVFSSGAAGLRLKRFFFLRGLVISVCLSGQVSG